jgi:hypothetical protein
LQLYEIPQVPQLVALQVLQEEPWELENSPSLLWENAERSFLIRLPLQVGQDTSSSPNTKTSKSLSHSVQRYSNIGISNPHYNVLYNKYKTIFNTCRDFLGIFCRSEPLLFIKLTDPNMLLQWRVFLVRIEDLARVQDPIWIKGPLYSAHKFQTCLWYLHTNIGFLAYPHSVFTGDCAFEVDD